MTTFHVNCSTVQNSKVGLKQNTCIWLVLLWDRLIMISPSSLPPSITGVGVSSYHQDQTLYEAELAGLLTVPRGLVSMVSLTLFVLPCVNLTPSLVSSLSLPSLYKHKPGSERVARSHVYKRSHLFTRSWWYLSVSAGLQHQKELMTSERA